MYHEKKSAIIRFVAVVMIVAMLLPAGTNAVAAETAQPRASYYLSIYNAYVYIPGGGQVRVYFNAEGTGYMDELGALSIQIYECSTNSSDINDWTWKKTFKHNTTSGMLSYNDDYHSGYVTYNGTVGKYYKAYVCIWGGQNGSGDTRYFWTSAKKCV